MGTMGNNEDGNKSLVRDSFFTEGEKEYFEELMKKPEEKKIHNALTKENVQDLFDMAMELINRVEAGEFDEKQMEKVERLIAHLLAAIEDLQRVLELELTMDI